ncbi:MAG: ABC transporter substrate-binding protein [Clostridia bacterium]|nr:ABC transporter substrate-binding protein [Clostridia bacterium]
MMKAISRVSAIVMSLAMVVSLAACGSKKQDEVSSDLKEVKTVSTEVKVGALYGPTGVSMAKLATEKSTIADAFSDGENLYTNTYAADYVDEPTQMVAKISSGEVDIACVPTNLAAKLYKVTGGNIKVAAVSTLGVLYMLDTSGEVKSVADLKGRTVYAPSSMQGSNPEYILNFLLKKNALDDAKVSYEFTVDELTAKMVSGDVQTAMFPEPKVTAIKGQLKKAEKAFTVTDMQAEWNKVCDTTVAQGVVVVRTEWLKDNEGAFKTFLNDFAASSDAVVNDLDNTVGDVVELGVIPNETLAKAAIPNCNIVCVTGEEMKKSVAGFLNVLLEADPQSVGGALPDDGFYYVG